MTDFQKKKALDYAAQGLVPKDIAEKFVEEYGMTQEYWYKKIRNYIYKAKKRGFNAPGTETPKRIALQNQEPEHHKAKWDGCETLKFAIMGDTQFGSKYAQITYLHDFYDLCAKEGIKDVYHTGDITDGLKMRPGHEYELYEVSADEMRDDVVNNYPKRDGITTHFITGNHDASIYKR